MPDITMCVNSKCPVREWCYRYRAIPSQWQSFCRYEPRSYRDVGTITDQCDRAWSIKGYEHKIRPMKDIEPKETNDK